MGFVRFSCMYIETSLGGLPIPGVQCTFTGTCILNFKHVVKESIEKMDPTIITAGYIMKFWEMGGESLYRLELLFNPLVNWFT